MSQRGEPRLHPLLKADEIAAMPEVVRQHPLNVRAIRHSRSLGDATGLTRVGVHMVRVRPGDSSTEYHRHENEDEWLYVVSGRGVAELGDERIEIGPGDFLGHPAGGLAHAVHNPFDADLVYLVGGERAKTDVVHYPHVRKRLVVGDGEERMLDLEVAAEGTPPPE